MPNPGDFDPAKAIQGLRQAEEAERQRKEAERQRAQAEQAERRANILELLRYADKELEAIRNAVVSEFVITERWWTPESKWTSSSKKRADQDVIGTRRRDGFFTDRIEYKFATRDERQTSYSGSWLWLDTSYHYSSAEVWGTPDTYTEIKGLVKLRQPHTGYAYVRITAKGRSYRNSNYISIELTDRQGQETKDHFQFQTYASLKEAVPCFLGHRNLKYHTQMVKQALDFVETGQPPKPKS